MQVADSVVCLILLAPPHDQIHQNPSKHGVTDQLHLGHSTLEAITESSPIRDDTFSVERYVPNIKQFLLISF